LTMTGYRIVRQGKNRFIRGKRTSWLQKGGHAVPIEG
jgi:hypothetical protein